jgi:prepilin-type N-terminal cleavage/methylation domain-containing protein
MKKQSQKGFTLLELLLVIGISTSMAIVTFQDKMLETEQAQARRLGMELFQYNSAVQNYLAHQSGSPNPASLAGTKTGINWLKSTTCTGADKGTADKEWLSCGFLSGRGEKTSFGSLDFKTTISYNPTSGLSAKTVMSKLSLGLSGATQDRADLSGLAALVASGAYSVSDQNGAATAQDGSIVYCPDLPVTSPSIAAMCGTDKGVITMMSRNLSAADRWLRVDHGNVMQNALEFRTGDATPASAADMSAIDTTNRQIRNVARIYNLGNSNSNGESDNLILGKKSLNSAVKTLPTLTKDSVIIDADQEVLGKLIVASSITARDDITSEKNIIAKGNLSSNMDTWAGRDVIAGRDLSVGRNANFNGDLKVKGNINADGDIISKNKLSVSDTAYIGNTFTAAKDVNVNGSLTSNGRITGKSGLSVTGDSAIDGTLYTRRIIDLDDGNYYVDPNGASRLNSVTANAVTSTGRLSTNEYLYIGGIAYPGSGCSPNGLVGRDGAGKLVSCESGVWASTSNARKQLWSGSSHSAAFARDGVNLITISTQVPGRGVTQITVDINEALRFGYVKIYNRGGENADREYDGKLVFSQSGNTVFITGVGVWFEGPAIIYGVVSYGI